MDSKMDQYNNMMIIVVQLSVTWACGLKPMSAQKVCSADAYLFVVDVPLELRDGVGLPRGAVEATLVSRLTLILISCDVWAIFRQVWGNTTNRQVTYGNVRQTVMSWYMRVEA
jgi:hypothetical protein